ncbi:MAG: hypothetical protein JXR96_09630 [Deltaproteobacteria bacterium]|nr:hypothetical protein [Deltaproteobacteria bacterium]
MGRLPLSPGLASALGLAACLLGACGDSWLVNSASWPRPEPAAEKGASPELAAAIWAGMGNRPPVAVEQVRPCDLCCFYLKHWYGQPDRDRKPSAGFDLAMAIAQRWWWIAGLGRHPLMQGLGHRQSWYAYRAATLECAAWISWHWSTEQVLATWARQQGLEERALRLFGKELDGLESHEIAFLVALRSPRYDWFCKSKKDGLANRNRLLMDMQAAGAIGEAERARASKAPLPEAWVASREQWPCNHDAGSLCGPKSDACRIHGVCEKADRGCRAGSDAMCRASWLCRGHGACTASDGRCAATRAEDCRKSLLCELRGRCALDAGRCAAGSDEDCRRSRACEKRGLCRARDGACAAGP